MLLNIFSIVPLNSRAAEQEQAETGITIGSYQISVLNDGTAEITRYSGKDSVLSIPSTIGYRVTSIGSYAFYGCTSLTEITIPDSVTKIGYCAFDSCTNLKSVTIGKGAETIGNLVFDDCKALERVTFLGSNTEMNYLANHGNYFDYEDNRYKNKFTFTIVGYSGSTAHKYAYELGLDFVSLGNAHVSGTTGDCTWELNGTEMTISGNGNIADYNCVLPRWEDRWHGIVTKVTISHGVKNVGEFAFVCCDNLESVVIFDSVTSIDDSAFRECKKLTSIIVDKNNPVYDSRDNCNAIIHTNSNTLIVGGADPTIPNSVTDIGNHAYDHRCGLTSITIPESVMYISYDAFNECQNLNSITVNKNNPVYDSRENCNAVIEKRTNKLVAGSNNTVIPKSVKKIGDYAFSRRISLNNIEIPDNVTSIGNYAFYNCVGLNNITLPEKTTIIGFGAFNLCYNLKTITIPDKVTAIGDYAFSYCIRLTNVKIGNSTTDIGNYAFDGCESLTEIIFSNSITTIGDFAFRDCTNLKIVDIPYRVTDIGLGAFGYYWGSGTVDYEPIDGFTIYGYTGTVAETYAKKNGFTFISLGNAPKSGDADGDGEITIMDVTDIQHYLSVMKTHGNEKTMMFADVDKNGRVEILDATWIQRHLAGIDIPYPIG